MDAIENARPYQPSFYAIDMGYLLKSKLAYLLIKPVYFIFFNWLHLSDIPKFYEPPRELRSATDQTILIVTNYRNDEPAVSGSLKTVALNYFLKVRKVSPIAIFKSMLKNNIFIDVKHGVILCIASFQIVCV